MIGFCKIFYVSFIELLIPFYFLYRYFMGSDPERHESVKEYFADLEFLKRIQEKGTYKKTSEKAHGQLEIREYYQTADIKWIEQKGAWKGRKRAC